MANNKSAKKRIGIAKRNRLQNLYYKTSVRTLTKLFFKTLEQTPESKEKLQTIVNSIYSFLDKGTKKNVFHKNTAARQKARIASALSNNS
uniref:ribosomal protein S20 n=1 Tax=Pseudo-nitzschia multistriata TaxID=183589 RepID=UPI001D107C89|nr:ribosomal protein S20 [Pseudo-nitzschia multistriata]UBA15274.1 ribosomal protein S20 [Pseudo-nitzschia multistriata]